MSSSQQQMFAEAELPNPNPQNDAQNERPVNAPASLQQPAPVWLQRLSLLVLVLFCFLVGGLTARLPWMPRYWDQNGWLLGHPAVHALLARGWVRGLVSGVGLIDIWIGVSELLHYKDIRQ